MADPTWHQQLRKMSVADGFIAALDQSGGSTPKALRLYGIDESRYQDEAEMMDKIHDMRSRIVTNPKFDGSRVLGAILFERTMDSEIDGLPAAKYLWERKRIVPFLKVDRGLVEEQDGVQLMKDLPDLEALLDRGIAAGILGTKERSVIKHFNAKGIRDVVKQQFEVAHRVIAKGLVPILEPEIDIRASDKEDCERFLLDCLLESLHQLPSSSQVMFKLTLPSQPNLYMPLMAHPCTVRVVALSGGYSRLEACKKLAQNAGMIASYSRAFTEGMREGQSEAEFTRVLDESVQAISDASRSLDTVGMQLLRVGQQDGFIAVLEQSGVSTPKALQSYGIDASMHQGEADMMDMIHEMHSRIIQNPEFNGSRVVMAILSGAAVDRQVEGLPTARYLWDKKRVLPILKVDKGLQDERNGVQLMKEEMMQLRPVLDRAVASGCFGTEERSVIKHFHPVGIRAVVQQQFAVARDVIASGLVPILHLDVDAAAKDKEDIEEMLLDCLLEGLRELPLSIRVMFKLAPPTRPNLFLPLVAHPCTLRVMALPSGCSRSEACGLLAPHVGVSASFSRALTEGLRADQSDGEFTKTLGESCQAIFDVSRSLPTKRMQMVRVQQQDGFIAALDQSGGSTPKALRLYGIDESMYKDEAEMMDKMHEMRSRIITNPKFDGSRVVMAILFESTMHRHIDGVPSARYLWERKHIVPMLKIDKGLQEEKDGVQLMREMPLLDVALDRAVESGMFGTKERSLIKHFNVEGIRAIVQQQFKVARRVLERGLVPILEPEVDIRAPDKEACERLLLEGLLEGLRQLPPDSSVIFKLTLPTQANLYLPLMMHPCTARVVALSGGYTQSEACKQLSQNAGMSASFSRAFTEKLCVKQAEDVFTKILDSTCQAIFDASRSLSTRKMQMIRAEHQDGFVAPLDHGLRTAPDALFNYGVGYQAYCNDMQMMIRMDEMRSRIFTNQNFNGSRILGAILSEGSLHHCIDGLPVARYLSEQRHVIPFMKVDKGLHEEREGVELMKEISQLEAVLDRAKAAGIFGTKARSTIKHFHPHGIEAVVQQQFVLARRIMDKGMIPILEPEVDIHAADKEICERLLRDLLLKYLRQLPIGCKVMLMLTLPSQPNLYLPLTGHPNVLRVLGDCGGDGNGRDEACEWLQKNAGIVSSFGWPFLQGLHVSQTDEAITLAIDESCEQLWQASRRLSTVDMQTVRIHEQDGFFAALDQSIGSTAVTLRKYGMTETAYANTAEMMDRKHQMLSRIITNRVFDGSRIVGVMLCGDTLDREIDGLPSAQYLWERKHIVSFMKVDRGVLEVRDGVQMMKDMPELDERLDRAVNAGVYGTTMRSVIRHHDPQGVEAVVRQQFEVAEKVLAKGLVPILEPEVSIQTETNRDKCERALMDALLDGLRRLPPAHKVIFKLTPPSVANLYQPLAGHPNTLRVLALSGPHSRAKECDVLSENRGMIAGFNRPLLEGLRWEQADEDFTRSLDEAIEDIFVASQAGKEENSSVGAAGGA